MACWLFHTEPLAEPILNYFVNWILGKKLLWDFNQYCPIFLQENILKKTDKCMTWFLKYLMIMWYKNKVQYKHIYIHAIYCIQRRYSKRWNDVWQGNVPDSIRCKNLCSWCQTVMHLSVLRIICTKRWRVGVKVGPQAGVINSSPLGQNGCYFADNIFRCICMNEKFCISIKISLKFVAKGLIDNNPALV